MTPRYPEDKQVVPGEWEHRSGECPTHGDNVPFARPRKSIQPHLCVECMISAAQKLYEKEGSDVY